jgi:uncharacterized membrane protein
MDQRPLDIRRFEALQLACSVVNLVHEFAMGASVFGSVFGAVVVVTLTLLVSRRRQNWARWTLAVMLAIGVAGIIWAILIGFPPGIVPHFYPLLTAFAWFLQVASMGFVFTPESSRWLRTRPSQS